MKTKEPYARAGYKNKEKVSNEIQQLRKMLWNLKKGFNGKCWCNFMGVHSEECIKIQNYFKAKPFIS